MSQLSIMVKGTSGLTGDRVWLLYEASVLMKAWMLSFCTSIGRS